MNDFVSLPKGVFTVAGAVLGIGVLLLATLGIFIWLLELHWAAGTLLLLFYGYAVYLGLRDLQARALTDSQAIGVIAVLVALSIALFATASYMLEAAGIAEYGQTDAAGGAFTGSRARFVEMLLYYGWVFLDLLPVVEITETLHLVAPFEASGLTGGVPVVVFKAFVALILLRVVRDWWRGRGGGMTAKD